MNGKEEQQGSWWKGWGREGNRSVTQHLWILPPTTKFNSFENESFSGIEKWRIMNVCRGRKKEKNNGETRQTIVLRKGKYGGVTWWWKFSGPRATVSRVTTWLVNKNRGEARLVYQSPVQTPRDVSFFCGRNRVCVVYTYIYINIKRVSWRKCKHMER